MIRRVSVRALQGMQSSAPFFTRIGRNIPAISRGCEVFFASGVLALTAVPAYGIEIVPHRAAYAFEVVEIDSRSGITDISGGMTFEWADTCDGWSTDQRYLLRITNEDGGEIVSQSSSVNWESKDGRRLRFNSKRERNGETVDLFRGEAVLDKAGGSGVARFSQPRDEEVDLPSGTRLPTDLTLLLMEQAARGEFNFQGLVFEGGEIETSQPVTNLTLPKRQPGKESILEAPLGPNPVWPMFMAYFTRQNGDDIPETEISLDIQENGIVPRFTLNYGTFKLRARLARIQALPAVKC